MKKIISSILAVLMISAMAASASASVMTISHGMISNTDKDINISTDRSGTLSEDNISERMANVNPDDAEGLSISEKMRGQIQGKDKASTSSQDGIGMIQDDGETEREISAILLKIKDLALKASAENITEEEREAINAEITELQNEIERIRTEAKEIEFSTDNIE